MKTMIVGGGLAGLCVAKSLMERGEDFFLFSSPNLPSSTAIATGMYNPIVFRHINKSWMIDELAEVFHPFYRSVSELVGQDLIRPIEFVKRIPSDEYRQMWDKRVTEPGFSKYLLPIVRNEGEVLNAGMVDTGLFMKSMFEHLRKAGHLMEEDFEETQLEIKEDQVSYKGETYGQIILSTGAFARKSDLFGWLPFNICKGEWARIQSEDFLTKGRTLNNVINIIPEGEGIYKLSSTYSWRDYSWTPEEHLPGELRSGFMNLFNLPFKVLERKAGLRPTVADRRPYLGRHPKHKCVFIFNGLGSKGVMLAPYFAQHLVNHILDKTPLMPEVNISRHYKRFERLGQQPE